MNYIQARVHQLRDARILYLLRGSLIAAALTMASTAAGSPIGIPGQVLVDPTYTAPPAPGGSLAVTTPPVPPLNVISPLTFNFTPVGNLLAMQSGTPAQVAKANQVINSFVIAGDRWRALFADPITVNLDINYGPIGNNVLGGTLKVSTVQSYSTVRTRLGLDATSSDDVTAVASLQVGASMDFMTNDTSTNSTASASPRIRDSDTVGTVSNNNNFMSLSRANAKALGIALVAGPDANITFTDFTDYTTPPPAIDWDFDPTDGISSNRFDFVGVATHEIGHAMGFFSGIDTVDYYGSPNGPGRLPANGGPLDLDPSAIYNTLDLYRFSANSLSQSSQPVGGLRDGAYGQAGSRPYFSINSGATNLTTFSTGNFNGDGRQASHWQDGLGIGIMDPTLGLGELGVMSTLDRRAMDVIGWDFAPVPEPTSLALFFMAILGLLVSHARSTIRPVN